MTMTPDLPDDCIANLRAQGMPEAEIIAAQSLATRLSRVADGVPHDPLGPAAPGAFGVVLAAEPTDGTGR